MRFTYRSNNRGMNIILVTLQSQGPREADQSHLGRAVIGLTQISYKLIYLSPNFWNSKFFTIKTSYARNIDDPSKFLFSHDRPGSSAAWECAFQMYCMNGIPISVCHVFETRSFSSISIPDRSITHLLSLLCISYCSFGMRSYSPKYTGIVDQNGYGSKAVHGCLNHRGTICDRGCICYRPPTS